MCGQAERWDGLLVGVSRSRMCGRGNSFLSAEDDDACGRRWASGEVLVCCDGGTWCWCKMLRKVWASLEGRTCSVGLSDDGV